MIIKFGILILSVLLSACASPPVNHADGVNLTPQSGLLVVGLHTDWDGHTNPLLAKIKLLLTADSDLSSGNGRTELVFQGKNYFSVIELPANKYKFYRLHFSTYFWNIKKNNEFIIKPNTITYVGDITVDNDRTSTAVPSIITVADSYDNAKEYMNKNYPKLLSKYSMEKDIAPLKVKLQ